MIKNLIFDLDGTLLDTLPDLTDSLNQVLSEYPTNHKVSLAKMKSYVGDGARIMLERALKESGLVLSDKAFEEFRRKYLNEYENRLTHKTLPYHGAIELLESFHSLGYELFLFSNKPDPLTGKLVTHFNLANLFKKAKGAGEIPHKPSPCFFQMIKEERGLKEDETVMIGDGLPDITFARNAGIISIAILNGYSDPEAINKLKPDYTIKDLTDVKKVLEQINSKTRGEK